jgi:hypothetical protein
MKEHSMSATHPLEKVTYSLSEAACPFKAQILTYRYSAHFTGNVFLERFADTKRDVPCRVFVILACALGVSSDEPWI